MDHATCWHTHVVRPVAQAGLGPDGRRTQALPGVGADLASRDRLYHYRVALGSLKEAKAAVELVVRLALVDGRQGTEALELLDRSCAATWRLVQATSR